MRARIAATIAVEYAAGVLGGAVAAPILLPWIPGRAFALKGTLTGMVAGLMVILAFNKSLIWMVCPHGVFSLEGKKASIRDRNGCMECGACALNCPAEAVQVTPGVDCAAHIIQTWIRGKEAAACGGVECC